jgi:hypothetical protein
MTADDGSVPRLAREVSMTTVRLWRTVMGAIVGVACAMLLAPFVGAIWGAVNQAAPCYGGAAEHSVADRVVGGALFGTLAFVASYSAYAILAGTVAGAALVNLLAPVRTAATRRVLNFLYPSQKAHSVQRNRLT